MADLAGFGREEYGSGPYGQAVPVSVTGVAGTGGLGTVSILLSINIVPTGVAGTGGIGTVQQWQTLLFRPQVLLALVPLGQ